MKKRIKNDDEIKNLDFKEIEYFINNLNELSLDQILLLMNKSLKMKFDEQSINKLTKEIENRLNKINSLYEIKRIQKKMYDLNIDTTYINKLKKKFLLKEINNPKSDISKIYTSIILNSKKRDE
jgi:hypothetical protein